MSPGARRRRSAKRRKLGPTRLQRERARERKAAARATRVIRGRSARATFLIDGEEVTFSDAFSGIDRGAAPSFEREVTGWSPGHISWSMEGTLGAGPLYFTTDHDDLTLWEMVDRHTHDVLAAPQPMPMTVVSPEVYAQIATRLTPYVDRLNTAETRLSIGHEIHAELDELLRAGVQPFDGGDDRVDALAYGIRHVPPRHAMSTPPIVHPNARCWIDPDRRRFSVFARAARLRAELVDLLTTPDGFPFVAE